ncbi:MAG: NADH-quinone oxidoreductase subunit C, partial [Candidatus Binatia bacterium]
MDVALRDLGEYVQASVVADVLDVSMEGGELCIVVRRDSIARVLAFLRDDINCQFKQLMDV